VERLAANDVLTLIRRRVARLETENRRLRDQNELLQQRRKHWWNQAKAIERSRDAWREKAKTRQRQVETMRFYLVSSHPMSKAHLRDVARRAA
jgi:hypothetical protein